MLLTGDLQNHKDRDKKVSRKQFIKLAERLGFGGDIGETVFDVVYNEHAQTHGKKVPASGIPESATLEAAFLLRVVHDRTANLR